MTANHASEEELMRELDRMYLRVADLESPPATAQNNPDECDQNSDQRAATHEKVIPFPVRRIHVTSGKPSEEKLKHKRKPWYRILYRPYLLVIFLLLIPLIILAKLIITSRDSEKTGTHQQTFPIPLERLVPTQTEDSGRSIEKKERVAETQPDQTTKRMFSLSPERHYTVQVGAFHDWENTRNLIEALQNKGLEGHWVEITTKDGGSLHRVFSGYFIDNNEATKYMRDRGIFNDYPGSFVREISSNKVERGLPPRANRKD